MNSSSFFLFQIRISAIDENDVIGPSFVESFICFSPLQ